ncbi:MAG: helix-turn-helix transcriptional regulator [Phycisphaerae bacterium]|nr:helix-turn-helix transcriptional regulator [Phycisphaerae bacterium]
MSKSRQRVRTRVEPGHGRSVRSMALRLPDGRELPEHAHAWAQVVFAARGVLWVEASSMRWIVPPQRCLWVPPGTAHRVRCVGEVHMRTVYVCPKLGATVGKPLGVLGVSPLLRELILEVVRIGVLDDGIGAHRALALLLAAQMAVATPLGLALRMPTDPRARAVAERVLASLKPGDEDDATIAGLTRGSGASVRTAERLFVRETGVSFGRWRQQARLQFAVRRLAEGVAVGTVALECGYGSVSAFVSMFRHALGTTPGRYCAGRP